MEEDGRDKRANSADSAVGVGTSLIVLLSGRFAAVSDIGELDILREAGRCRVARAILRTSAGARNVRRFIISGDDELDYG